jgi:acetoin utilization protein AcuB
MTAAQFIDHSIAFLKPTDTSKQAIDTMLEQQTHWLPVVNSTQLLGYVALNTLTGISKKQLLADLPLQNVHVHIAPQEHALNIAFMFQKHQCDSLAVLDHNNLYQGCITFSHFTKKYFDIYQTPETGAIIEIQFDHYDYSFAKIAALTEAENIKILQSNIQTQYIDDQVTNTLTIKLNREMVQNLVATLERFGYNITGVYGSSQNLNMEQQRINQLLKYLEV